jgi:hypothetical protein
VVLDSANDFVGALSVSAASATVKDSNALDLGTITLSGDLTVTAGGALSDSGVLSVGGSAHQCKPVRAWCSTAPTTSVAH